MRTQAFKLPNIQRRKKKKKGRKKTKSRTRGLRRKELLLLCRLN